MPARRILKILHEISTCGVIGSLAAHGVLLTVATASALEYAAVRRGIEAITQYVLLPSLGVVLFTGLLAIAVHHPFHGAGWAWVKLLLGMSMFEGTLGAVNATARDASALAAKVASGEADPSALQTVLRHEWGGLGVILFLSLANIVLGVWRPKLSRSAQAAEASADEASDQ